MTKISIYIIQNMPKRRNPKRRQDGSFEFPDCPMPFHPNVSPKEILKYGAYGGSYFRDIRDEYGTLHKGRDQISEFPQLWFKGLNLDKYVHSPIYDIKVNCYRAKCGTGLKMWHEKKWMRPQDPYGWFQWYCRFFAGRRDREEDTRQIKRANAVMGASGRWRVRLTRLCERNKVSCKDPNNYPVLRQILLHWGFRIPGESSRKLQEMQARFDKNPPKRTRVDPYTMKYV